MTSLSPLQNPLGPSLESFGGDAESRDSFIIERAVSIGDVGLRAEQALKMPNSLAVQFRAITGLCQVPNCLRMALSPRPVSPQTEENRIAAGNGAMLSQERNR
jgi:hypothetical protein